MDNIKITIVTITYNCENSVEKTINSVLSQDYENIEYIIIDGKSTDSTMDVINKYYNNLSLVISEKDAGISDAFNKGIAHATGDLILLLNAGDVFISDNIISNAVFDWINNKNPDVLFYKVRVGERTYIPNNDEENIIWESCQEPHQGSFISKKAYKKVGLYDLKYKLRMDYDFFARCKELKISHKYISKEIVQYEVGGASMQTKNAQNFYKEGLAIKRKYNIKIDLLDYIYLYMPNCIRKFWKKLKAR